MEEATKACSRCHQVKPGADFNAARANPDGKQSYCRKCQVVSNRLWSERNPELERAAGRLRNLRYPGGHNGARTNAGSRAHLAVRRAIKKGLIVRPEVCPKCLGNGSPVHAHHEDYSRPLDIRWLCARCHRRLHAGILDG